MHRPFGVRIAIDTPIAARQLLHLDGLLGSIRATRGEDAGDLPLKRTAGVWHASAALIETGTFGALRSHQRRLKHVNASSVPEDLFRHLPAFKRRIGEMSPYRNALSDHPLLEGVFAVWFVGHGCRESVGDLLGDLRGLGTMSQTGYGHITGIEAVELPDRDLTGISLQSGLPARAVPVEVWKELGLPSHGDAILSQQRAAPPYWTGPEVPCLTPMQVDLMGTRRSIAALIGLT